MVQPIIFVTGTDTDVGKTFVSTLLAYRWKANYWKPVQTGIESDTADCTTVSKAGIVSSWQPKIFVPTHEMLKPLSPYKAMDYEPEVNINLSDFKIPEGSENAPLIVEGAGGVLVPVTRKLETMTDLMRHISKTYGRPFKIVVVTRSGLGTLNHTLLTTKYLHSQGLGDNLLGIIVNGKSNKENVQVFQDFGIEVMAEVEPSESPAAALDYIPPLENYVKTATK